jgi:hypothetical protein
MLIPVTVKEGEPPAWAMVELQGEIEINKESVEGGNINVGKLDMLENVSIVAFSSGRSLAAMFCDLSVASFGAQGSAKLTIGYHQLEGKLQKLPKPFAVMEKLQREDGDGIEYKARPSSVCSTKLCRIG